MNISGINTIKFVNYQTVKNDNVIEKNSDKPSFDFSSVSSNAIKSNALANISFKSQKKLGTPQAIQKEMQLKRLMYMLM